MIKTFIKKEWVIITIIITAFIVRIIYLSPWLEDWDSVQFALALKDFSIVKHQPHPPGYPLYILLGRIINLFVRNETLSLTLLSALFGSLSALPLYLIIKNFANRKIACLSAILFLATPVHWTLSEVALTNIVGLSFLVTSVYFLYRGLKSDKHLLIGSFLSGITIGVRFAEYSTILLIIAFVVFKKKKWSRFVKVTIALLAGILIWLIPIIIDTGLNDFINLYLTHTAYIKSHDSIFSGNTSLFARLLKIKNLLVIGYSKYYSLIVGSIAFYFLTNKKSFKKNISIFAFIWLVSYSALLVFIYNLELTRYTLPLLPPIIILSAVVLNHYWKTKITSVFYVVITVLVLSTSIKQAHLLKNLIPPTIAPVIFVKGNFNPKNTTLITTFTYRQFQYYAPEFDNYWGTQNVPENINSKTVILDYRQLRDQVPSLENYKIIDEKTFEGPVDVFPRLPKTNLYILEVPSF